MDLGWLQYAILPPILYLGIITSIEDIRFGKIYQRHILLGLWLGIGWYAALGLFYLFFFDTPFVFTTIVPKVLSVTLLGLLITGAMWWFNVWSAADAKLFVVLTFLSPPMLLMRHDADYFASMVLLVNTYAMAFVIITGDFLIRLSRRIATRLEAFRQGASGERREMIGEIYRYLAANVPGWLKTFLGFTFILMMVRLLRSVARDEIEAVVHLNQTLLFLLLFLAFRPLHQLFQIRILAVLLLLGIIGFMGYQLTLDPSGALLIESVSIGAWALGLIMFRQIYTYWCELVEVRRIPLQDLKPHMILSELMRQHLVRDKVFTEEEMAAIGVEGLGEEEAMRVRHLFKDPEEPDTVEIENTIPFAPFILAGLFATYLVRDVLVRFG